MSMRKEIKETPQPSTAGEPGRPYEEVTFRLRPVASHAEGRKSISGGGSYKCKGPGVGLENRQNSFLYL